MSEISSGLVAVACMQLPGSANIERLCRLSDAEVEIERLSNLLSATEAHIEWNKLKSVIAAKDAEIESSRRTAEYWKANHLSGNELIEQQSAALKLAREALKFDGYPCGTGCKCIACESLAAIDALGE